SKFMLPWSFSEEAAAEKYMAQLQHNMWVTARCIAHATSARGGGRWASTRSRLPADFGNKRTGWDSAGLDGRYQYLGRMALPRPLIQTTRTSAPLRVLKKKPVYRIFPASRTTSGSMFSRVDK